MTIVKRKHYKNIYIIIISFILYNCSFDIKKNNHGLSSLENREKILVINKSNKNDIIRLIGKPHTTSLKDPNKWIYFERRIEKGKLHKLGRNVLTENNVLELNFDKYGVLLSKKIININDMNKVNDFKKETVNTVRQKSAIAGFLSSIKQKMYRRKKN